MGDCTGQKAERVTYVKKHGGVWGWAGWRWDRKAKGYRTASPPANWSLNEDWQWDGEVLRPASIDGWVWSPRHRKWIVAESTSAAPA